MKVAVVQTKPHKGLIDDNLADAGMALAQLRDDYQPDLVVFPEGAFTGYFLEGALYELARSPQWYADQLASMWHRGPNTPRVDIICGFYENDNGTFYNSALYATIDDRGGRVQGVHRKMFLATYGVFDEERFISRGRKLSIVQTRFGPLGMLICEDVWHSITSTIAAVKGARFIVIPSASPGRGIGGGENGELESVSYWRNLLKAIAMEHGVFVIYAGLAGFEGGKGMTGSSCIVDPTGAELVRAPALGKCIIQADLDLDVITRARATLPLIGDLAAVLPDLLLDEELPLPRRVGS